MGKTDEIEAAASDWLARRDSGEWSEEDEARFNEWFGQSPLHPVAYLRLEHIWERSQRLKALSRGVAGGGPPPPGRWHFFDQALGGAADSDPLGPAESRTVDVRRGSEASRGRRRWAFAASLLLCMSAAAVWYGYSSGHSYRTPVGGLSSIPMSDGSKVTLNTDSQIRVSVTQQERRVELDQGEAFFEVAKDARRPFVVAVGARRVIAVGTKFSVRRGPGATAEVIVTEGKVRVEGAPARSDAAAPTAQPVSAGSVAQVSDAGVLVQAKSVSAAEESLSWREGILVFHEITLAAAAAEFNRYNDRKIHLTDAHLGQLRVAGSFRTNNVEGFVRLLERGYPLEAVERDGDFSLRPR